MDIADFFDIYPDNPSQLQSSLAGKREFLQYRGDVNDVVNKPLKEFFNHQSLVGRLMFVIDRCLLLHKTGTGKTCTLETTASTLTAMMTRWGFQFKTIYVVIDESLKNNLRNELANVCNPDKYLTPEIRSITDTNVRMRKLRRHLKRYFTFITRNKMSKLIKGILTDDELQDHFRNSLMFIDEAHLLLDLDQRSQPGRSDTMATIKEQRKQFRRLFRAVHELKLILSTATPAINKPYDAIKLVNLMLPKVDKIDVRKDFDGTLSDIDKQKLAGLISFVEAPLPRITIEYVGVPYQDVLRWYTPNESLLPSFTTNVFPVPFSKYQLQALQQLRSRQRGDNFAIDEKYIDLFVYHDLTYHITDHESRLNNPAYDTQFTTELADTSPRYYHFLKLHQQHPDKKSFTYVEFVRGGGIKALSRVLDLNGFTEYDGSMTDYLLPPSTAKEAAADIRPINRNIFQPQPRYAVLTSDNKTHHDSIIKLYNHPENWKGDFLQILIGSDVIRFSYSFLDVSFIILMLPSWNRATMYQALSRGIRANSHRRSIAETGLDPYPVKIYQYCSY